MTVLPTSSRMTRLINLVLWPGTRICRFFNVQDDERLFFLRLYINLFIYTKLAVLLAVFLALHNLD